MIICTIFSYANSKPWLKTMLLFLKREGGHRCNENLERREKAALNSPVFKILIREGGHTLFYKVFKFNFVYFISFEKWGGGHLKNYVSLRLISGLCQFTASPPSNAACLDVERLNKISQIKFPYDLSKNMF